MRNARTPGKPAQGGSRLPAVFAAALLLGGMSGCTLLQDTLKFPEELVADLMPEKKVHAIDPVELQQLMMRFADDYLAEVTAGSEGLRRDGHPLDRVELESLRLDYADNVVAIATGQNAFANLLDMVALVTLTRITVESRWVPGEYRASALPLVAACRQGETQIWRIARQALTPAQAAELRKAILAWQRENHSQDAFRTVRALGFASMIAKKSRPSGQSGDSSVFDLLDIDPLSDIDPAVREIAKTRLFAERALYIAQKMPGLVRQQSGLFALKATEMPKVQELIDNTTRLAEAADRLSRVAQQLPGTVDAEQEKILAALSSERRGLTALASEVRLALTAGTRMVDATDGTLKTFGGVMAQIHSEAGPPNPKAEPFRIQDYAAAIAQVDSVAGRIDGILHTLLHTTNSEQFGQLSARFDALGSKARTDAGEMIDHAFRKLLLLALLVIAAVCAAFLGTAVAYRAIVAHWFGENKGTAKIQATPKG